LQAAGGYQFPASQTPWQELYRANVGQMQTGAVLELAVKYQRLAQTQGVPRHSHRGGERRTVTPYRVIETGRGCRLGEGPYWSVRQQALYWVDILGQTVFRLRPTDGSVA